MSSEPLLRVENLKTQFFTETGTVRAVDGISFEVYEGEIVGLVGESGAGKSVASMSLLRLVESPGEIVGGTIEYKGETIFDLEEGPDGELREHPDMLSESEMRERIRGREIAVIFQDPMESLNPVFTVGGQLREFIEINRELPKDEAKAEAVRMLREVGIPDPEDRYEEYPHQFSGGMRQRVLIAMALACEPNLIIADEPTTALDVTVEGQILDLVDDLQDRYDTSFIWVTHDMGVVAEICDRVNVMYLGEVVEQAPVDELFYDTKHPYTSALLDSMPRPDRTVDELEPIEGVMPEAINPPSGCRFHPRCPDAREVCTRVHPENLEVDQAEGYPHRAACVKHDVFDVGYDESVPLEKGDEAETRVGETGSDENVDSTVEEGQASTDGGKANEANQTNRSPNRDGGESRP
ncbi:ATP-binding cassette domain-containing protein [Natronorubrum sp. JWXQ-INN-674]|uniref:Nickel import system ATP-binding protein NikD n=1 Tax=Natronorubrum halalkaliphilum TaxID=2691917 RepID=A0A6B0VQC9_9EURY|nr:ABC transporter ATP-binding protein [Natronorubrum halalkaliphilum]MXV62679.1 ATP-binding cassette domain-containing protein [Natronorubrum halalkaliphilum]